MWLRVIKVVLFMVSIGAVALSAHAVAPANALITNTASMTYSGLTAPIQASVDVKVSLVTAAPNLGLVSNNVTVAENQTGTLSYTITANANGPDNYAINTPQNTATNAATTAAAVSSASFVPLGATAVAVAIVAGSNTITVPSDGVADGQVNGLTAGDTVVIQGQTYTIATIADNAAGNSTLTLTTNIMTVVAVGTLVAEQAVFTVSQSLGVVAAGVAQGTNDVSVTAASSNGQTSAAAVGRMTVLRITFEKWVSVNGAAFTRVTPNVTSGDTLTYRLITIVPVATTISGVVFRDTIPLFTTYVANSTRMDADGPNAAQATLVIVPDVNATTPLAQPAGMPVNSIGQAAGTIAATAALAAEVSVEFQVTVD
jgi:uncharacterized repeat protein (TIGR01451 family)